MSEQDGLMTTLARSWRESSRAQIATYIAVDVAIVWAATLAAYMVRFEALIPPSLVAGIPEAGAIACVVFVGLFWWFRLYHFIWRYVGVEVIIRLAGAVFLGGAGLATAAGLVRDSSGLAIVPISIPILISVFVFVGSAAFRSLGRMLIYTTSGPAKTLHRVLIVGAGDAGSLLLRDIENQPALGIKVLGFLDDARGKQGRLIRGIPVIGQIGCLPEAVVSNRIDEALVAIPSADVAERRRILDLCNEADVRARMIPGVARDSASLGVSDLRAVSIEDLLDRDTVRVDEDLISATLTDRVVAVTGAAGSIGAELCRQIMKMKPSRLLLLEIDESRLYEFYLELCDLDPAVPEMHICDIRDERKVAGILLAGKAEVVFHAAAYKHVPLMELAPDEAIKANVGGTMALLRACALADVGHFVLISTDKAVAPANVMGATKAIAERLCLFAAREGLRATTVRFGNVLGSRGSVVPLFEQQLRKGGPLRVTHRDATRYFMTIPEAARLVLQAQAMSEGGEIFVLEMGEQVHILDVAKKMISLSDSNAVIEFTGLRPGEKLHEILVHEGVALTPTGREKTLRVCALPVVPPTYWSDAEALVESARRGERERAVESLADLLPDYEPQSRP